MKTWILSHFSFDFNHDLAEAFSFPFFFASSQTNAIVELLKNLSDKQWTQKHLYSCKKKFTLILLFHRLCVTQAPCACSSALGGVQAALSEPQMSAASCPVYFQIKGLKPQPILTPSASHEAIYWTGSSGVNKRPMYYFHTRLKAPLAGCGGNRQVVVNQFQVELWGFSEVISHLICYWLKCLNLEDEVKIAARNKKIMI